MRSFPKTLTCCALLIAMAGCARLPVETNQKISRAPTAENPVVNVVWNGDSAESKVQMIEFQQGASSFSVEKIAKEYGCRGGKGAGLITAPGPVEIYRMACDSGKTFLAKCELRQCKAM